jgi:hypothetical protein
MKNGSLQYVFLCFLVALSEAPFLVGKVFNRQRRIVNGAAEIMLTGT